jgi:hypothetical protein
MALPGMKRLSMALVALAVTGTASAVPIAMDFSGVLVSRSTSRPGEAIEFDSSVAGTPFSARLVVELDEFGAPQFTDAGAMQRWSYAALEGVTGISAFLSIDGVEIDMAPYDRSRALVNVIETTGIPPTCIPDSCAPVTSDQYFVNFTSIKSQSVGGNNQFRSLQFGTSETVDPLIPGSATNFIDGMPLSLEAILMLPSMFDNAYLQSRLSFTDSYNICTDQCRTDYTQSTQMRIDSLNRYVVGVPEPGTAGLLGLGFALTLLARRRRGDSAAASLNQKGVFTPA